MEFIIYIAFFLLIYEYFLYPLLLAVFSKFLYKPVKDDSNYKPDVTIVIAAFNEEELISDVLDSIYQSDYPMDKISILVGSDGSNDGTDSILEEYQSKNNNLKYLSLPRAGKNSTLNSLFAHIDSEIVIFQDADILLLPNSISKLVSMLADPDVGCVISPLKIKNVGDEDNSGGFGEKLYQKYESQIRIHESKISTTVNSLGAFYGIKRSLHKKLPNDNVCDDLFNVYNTVYQRKRVIFDNDNMVEEYRAKSLNKELNRKIRIVAGGLATAQSRWKLLLPNYGWSALFLWSHKILRYMSPVNLLIVLVFTFMLPNSSGLYEILLYSQMIFYGFSIIGWLLEKIGIGSIVFKIPVFFVSMNVGLFLGILRYFSGKQNAKWNSVGLEK